MDIPDKPSMGVLKYTQDPTFEYPLIASSAAL